MGANAALPIAMIGSSLISGLFAPDGQELQTFEGEGQLDPRQTLGESKIRIEEMMRLLTERANRPVNLPSSYVQQPPVFTGGGLPMPIGVSGSDPALANPSLLSLGGLSNNTDPAIRPPRGGGQDRVIIPEGPNAPGPGSPEVNGPYLGTRSPNTSGPMRRPAPSGQSLFSGAGNVSEHDDLPQAAGAVELLLRSYTGR